METPLDLITKYNKELEEDTKLNILNLQDKQFSLPNVKHKWLQRYTDSRIRLLELNKKKESAFRQKSNTFPASISKAAIHAKFEKDTDIIDLNHEIDEQELLIDHLKIAIQQIFVPLSYAFRPMIDQMKMEEL